MPLGYWISVTIHILSAMLWLGGMFFLGIVGAPVLREIEPASLRQQLFHGLGERFRTVGWIAIAILIATGLLNLYYRGLLRWSDVLGNPAFWSTSLGRALAAKLAAVLIMLVAAAIHDFVLGPRSGRVRAGSPEAAQFRRRAALLARVNALVGVVLVVAAIRLARGA
ncbi:MAG: hypothetical protein MNPFHGCM_02145 [Gemmatimonadaceae bacterium]|nr:hypothetical protein [Gemmatimonadaceae bacterium]